MIKTKEYIKKGEGENYNYSQDHCFVKLSSRHTNGELCMVGELELIFDDETIILRKGDTLTVPPHVWHEARSVEGGKMLTLFKNGQFDLFLEQLSTLSEADFANTELMKSLAAKFDIYDA